MHQVWLTNYGGSPSSGHAAHTQSTDYVAVPAEAAPLSSGCGASRENETRTMWQMAKDFREVMHIAGDREDFVNIGKAAVRLPRIIS
jgi:hypothetical protein